MMSDDRDTIRLKSGRTVYANCGILGLRINGTFEVCEASGYSPPVSHGYDGDVNWPIRDWMDTDPQSDLTADDMIEIADRMIARWTEFRETLLVTQTTTK
jgi:hypothetical protein